MTYLLPRVASIGGSIGGRVIDHSQLTIDDGTSPPERSPSDDDDDLPTSSSDSFPPLPSSLPQLARVPTYSVPENSIESSTSVKYIFVNGVLKIHEGYCKEVLGATLPLPYPEQPLALLCSTEDVEIAYVTQCSSLRYQLQLASSSIEAIESVQDPSYGDEVGLSEQEVVTNLDQIMSLFDALDIPLGCLSKLMTLKNYHLHILVDNSTTSTLSSKSKYPISMAHEILLARRTEADSPYLTYWEYCESLVHSFVDLLCFVPMRSLRISFTNAPRVIFLDRLAIQIKPKRFQEKFHQKVSTAFFKAQKRETLASEAPSSSLLTQKTKLYESMKGSFSDSEARGEPSLLILFSSGGGISSSEAVDEIKKLTIHRPSPERCPVIFLPIGETREHAWMRGVCRPFPPSVALSRPLSLLASLSASLCLFFPIPLPI
jgi:hypothetical protein